MAISVIQQAGKTQESLNPNSKLSSMVARIAINLWLDFGLSHFERRAGVAYRRYEKKRQYSN